MAAKLFGLRFLSGKAPDRFNDATQWSADEPLDIQPPADLMHFAYPPESRFSAVQDADLTSE